MFKGLGAHGADARVVIPFGPQQIESFEAVDLNVKLSCEVEASALPAVDGGQGSIELLELGPQGSALLIQFLPAVADVGIDRSQGRDAERLAEQVVHGVGIRGCGNIAEKPLTFSEPQQSDAIGVQDLALSPSRVELALCRTYFSAGFAESVLPKGLFGAGSAEEVGQGVLDAGPRGESRSPGLITESREG
ncbi:hypothetical protein [Streptomyces anulatus]|uniref:hypothetical protein n=1 Tax=Streptomyces anulatus TaxID=1892 RepID=UPI0038676846